MAKHMQLTMHQAYNPRGPWMTMTDLCCCPSWHEQPPAKVTDVAKHKQVRPPAGQSECHKMSNRCCCIATNLHPFANRTYEIRVVKATKKGGSRWSAPSAPAMASPLSHTLVAQRLLKRFSSLMACVYYQQEAINVSCLFC